MQISLIVAMGENRVIGAGGKIPWHLPADFKHFKELTTGHPIVMGRKTFESIGKPLPGRTNIVITRDAGYQRDGVVVVATPEAALAAAASVPEGTNEVFIIGGAEIYKLFLPQATRVYLTKVAGTFEGDAFFPELGEGWELTSEEAHIADEKNASPMVFQLYERKKLPEE